MQFKKIDNLIVSESGQIFLASRQIYPDKTGLFPAAELNRYITSEEIMELWDYKYSVVKSLDTQIAHANICPTKKDGSRDITHLVQWKDSFKKPELSKVEKIFTIDLSKAVQPTKIGSKTDYSQCVSVQEVSKEDVQAENKVSKVQKGKWIVQNIPYDTAQQAADATGHNLKNIQRWCKNNKNNCSLSLK